MKVDLPELTVDGLVKRHRQATVVADVSFTVEPGTVTGLLGPNGAGKTTLLRMALGLVRPDGGRVTFGEVEYAALPQPTRTVGAALDSTGFHPARSGLGHLRTCAAAAALPASRAPEVAALVGLDQAIHRRVGGYSLGMRQRLAIATALLGDPTVLLLDEPANGLDPEGTAWLRGFLTEYAASGGTVIVSSHVLGEMQQLVDQVIVLDRGRVLAQCALADLVAAHGDLETAYFALTTGLPGRP